MTDDGNLLKIERQETIHGLIDERGKVTVAELSGRFAVSEATIRRDLEELDELGILRRIHGGAVRTERAVREPPMMQRTRTQQAEKSSIGQAAVQLIGNDETIFLGSGTTVLEIARHIPEHLHLTVITNSLPVVNELANRPQIEMIVIGGMLRQSELSMVGHTAEKDIAEFRADHVFMGMRAIDPARGFTNDFLPEVMTDRAILSIAPQVVVVADHTKFGRVSSVLLAPVTKASLILTDRATPGEIVAQLRELGVPVQQV